MTAKKSTAPKTTKVTRPDNLSNVSSTVAATSQPITPEPAPMSTTTPEQPASSAPSTSSTPAATDPNATLSSVVAQALTQIDAIAALVANGSPPLTAVEKRHSLRMRQGGIALIGSMLSLASQYDLEVSPHPIAPIEAQAALPGILQPLLNRLMALTQQVSNQIFAAQSEAWSETLYYYAVLRQHAATDTALASALAPVVAFFAAKRPPQPLGTPTRPQQKANSKAVARLQKAAPQLLAASAASSASTVAQPATSTVAPPPASPQPAATPQAATASPSVTTATHS